MKPVPVENPLSAAYLIDGSIFVIFNASAEAFHVSLPEGNWNLNICETIAGNEPLAQFSHNVVAAPLCATVLTRC